MESNVYFFTRTDRATDHNNGWFLSSIYNTTSITCTVGNSADTRVFCELKVCSTVEFVSSPKITQCSLSLGARDNKWQAFFILCYWFFWPWASHACEYDKIHTQGYCSCNYLSDTPRVLPNFSHASLRVSLYPLLDLIDIFLMFEWAVVKDEHDPWIHRLPQIV